MESVLKSGSLAALIPFPPPVVEPLPTSLPAATLSPLPPAKRKDDRLAFRVNGRRFKLSRPVKGSDMFYIRFDVPARLRLTLKIKYASWSLETNVVATAIERAKKMIQESLYGSPKNAQMERARPGYPTFGELIERYRPDPQEVRPEARMRNVSSLLMIVREVTGCADPRELRIDLIGGEAGEALARKWQRMRIERIAPNDELAQNSARVTINTALATARSVVSPKVSHCYEDLLLPDFSGFRNVRRLKVDDAGGYVPWTEAVRAAVVKDAEENLRVNQPLVYRAYWLMYRLGLRNSEVMWCRRSWLRRFSDGTGEFEIRRRADFKTKNRKYRTIALDGATMAELETMIVDVGPEDFLINDALKWHRHEVCYNGLNRWLRQFVGHERSKGAYELRKEAASAIADRPESEGGGIQAAADFLGDTVAVTEKHYRGRKRRVFAVRTSEMGQAGERIPAPAGLGLETGKE